MRGFAAALGVALLGVAAWFATGCPRHAQASAPETAVAARALAIVARTEPFAAVEPSSTPASEPPGGQREPARSGGPILRFMVSGSHSSGARRSEPVADAKVTVSGRLHGQPWSGSSTSDASGRALLPIPEHLKDPAVRVDHARFHGVARRLAKHEPVQNFELSPRSFVDISLVDGQGNAVAVTDVEALSRSSPRISWREPLASGGMRCWLVGTRGCELLARPYAGPPVIVTPGVPDLGGHLRIHVPRGVMLRGHVVGGSLAMVRAFASQDLQATALSETRCDAGGDFYLGPLAPGRATIVIELLGCIPAVATVEVVNVPEVDLGELRLERGGHVVVQIVRGSKPASGYVIVVTSVDGRDRYRGRSTQDSYRSPLLRAGLHDVHVLEPSEHGAAPIVRAQARVNVVVGKEIGVSLPIP